MEINTSREGNSSEILTKNHDTVYGKVVSGE